MIKEYKSLLKLYNQKLKTLKQKHNLTAIARLIAGVLFITTIYLYLKSENSLYLLILAIITILFFILLNYHNKIAKEQKQYKALAKINKDEISFLTSENTPFYNGLDFKPNFHFYANDVDVLGEKSLYQHLNRTATYIGQKTLAKRLLTPSIKDIKKNQKAIKELKEKLIWRQNINALAININDSKNNYNNLIRWTFKKEKSISKTLVFLTYLLPFLLVVSILFYYFLKISILLNIAISIFTINLIIVFSKAKLIKNNTINSYKIDQTIKQYAFILKEIEQTKFKSNKLNSLKQKLNSASKKIYNLSKLFSKIDSFQNIVASLFLNGFFLYHLHTLKQLINWKNKHSSKIINWLSVIGEIETLNSLANFSYNNPSYLFPKINKNKVINFSNLTHPLIIKSKVVGNHVNFNNEKFIILTGSNMSGKSTFLRTLAVNMILTKIGAVVCATKANVHPLKIVVSMQQKDSLSDNESYFFSEVKRLKLIANETEKKTCFVLLDEILRGTNSTDKKKGTIAYIKKLIANKSIGVIATHDLNICKISNNYPNLENSYFEAEIVNNELYFDYILKQGICKNQSASFLMKKMKII